MSNHVHLIAVPERDDSLRLALKHTHGRYAAYFNARCASSGHVWQGRYYSCPLDLPHLWAALRYTELNPVRAGMVEDPDAYPWSSAAAHCGGNHPDAALDMQLGGRHGPPPRGASIWTRRASWRKLKRFAEAPTPAVPSAHRLRRRSGKDPEAPSATRERRPSTERSARRAAASLRLRPALKGGSATVKFPSVPGGPRWSERALGAGAQCPGRA